MQNRVREFNKNFTFQDTKTRMLDIVSELGEVSKEVIKSENYGKKVFQVTDNFKMEIGDLLYSVLSLCNENNIDAESCLIMALNKYQSRLNIKKDMGSGK